MARHHVFDGQVTVGATTTLVRPANSTRSGLMLENQSANDMAFRFRSKGGSEDVTMPGTGADDGYNLLAGDFLFLTDAMCAAGDFIAVAAAPGSILRVTEF